VINIDPHTAVLSRFFLSKIHNTVYGTTQKIVSKFLGRAGEIDTFCFIIFCDLFIILIIFYFLFYFLDHMLTLSLLSARL